VTPCPEVSVTRFPERARAARASGKIWDMSELISVSRMAVCDSRAARDSSHLSHGRLSQSCHVSLVTLMSLRT
jgi:hypothetical protein